MLAIFLLFQYLGLIIAVTGSVFNVVFHVGLKEPPSDALRVWLEERKNGRHKQKKLKRQEGERNGEWAVFIFINVEKLTKANVKFNLLIYCGTQMRDLIRKARRFCLMSERNLTRSLRRFCCAWLDFGADRNSNGTSSWKQWPCTCLLALCTVHSCFPQNSNMEWAQQLIFLASLLSAASV